MKIALVGLGRTGKLAAEYLLERDVLHMAFCRDTSENAGCDLGDLLKRDKTGIVVDSIRNLSNRLLADRPDVLIDFSGRDFLKENMEIVAAHGVHIVTAVTDYTDLDVERFRRIGETGTIGIIMAPNITYGVNIMMLLAQTAARLMPDYDFEIVEEHHSLKKDVPSGTAKKVAHKIDRILKKCFVGDEKTIPVHSIRSGGIVGKHKLIIAGKYDQLEISHASISRTAFAEGAFKAACFIRDRKGFYEMEDVFKERNKSLLPSMHEAVEPAI